MDIKEKIIKAENYVSDHKEVDGLTMARNDAANIFADNFDEYMMIWDAFKTIH